MGKRLSIFVVAALTLLSLSQPSSAQTTPNAPAIFTYVSLWGVPRGQWNDIGKINADEKAALDPFMANGTLVGYGFFENRVHSDGGFTHGTWIQTSSLANLFKALEPIYAAPSTTSPVFAGAKHLDYLMVSTSNKANAVPNNSTGYLRVISAQIQPGKMNAFMSTYQHYLAPIYDKLATDGVIAWYQLDAEYNVQNAPDRVFLALSTRDADGLDKVRAVFDDLFAKNPAVLDELAAVTVPNSRNDGLARVTSMMHK